MNEVKIIWNARREVSRGERKIKGRKKSNSFSIKSKYLQDLDRHSNEPYTISLPFSILFFLLPFSFFWPRKKPIISISPLWYFFFCFLICAICPFSPVFFFPIFYFLIFFFSLLFIWTCGKKFTHGWVLFKTRRLKTNFEKKKGLG